MKLISTAENTDWRTVFEKSVQVDVAAIPTGAVYVVQDDEGRDQKKMETVDRVAFGFQTETGRGKGMQWVPTADLDSALDRLNYYAENGVENTVEAENWLSPPDAIDETIARVPRNDSEGNKIEGAWDISFRVRLGKGSKAARVPEEDFAEFVQMLNDVKACVPEAVIEVEAKIAKAVETAAAEAAEAAQVDSTNDGDDSSQG